MSSMAGMMSGMGMGSSGPFIATNQSIARGYWYGVAAAVCILTCKRLLTNLQGWRRKTQQRQAPYSVPSRPQGRISQACATATAILRELSYPQPIYFTGRFSRFFTPLPTGHWLLLTIYWSAILIFLWSDTILQPDDPMYAYRWEKVGFRAAWVSVTQIPFIYLLSCKFNPISLLTGISYERFNWLHRWAARTVFMTVIVHWSFFFREWWLADFVQLELAIMPMVKYGFGAWAVIGWMILSGFGFFRHASYELFVAQHICAAAVLLWLLLVHVPGYARYNIYVSIGFVAFDWTMRIVWNVLRNAHVLAATKRRLPGYTMQLESLPGNMVRVTIEDVDFKWKPGQHVYLCVPRLRPFELHPFTIANTSHDIEDHCGRSLEMLVKGHSGSTKALREAADNSARNGRTYRAFLSGPWGAPPDLLHFESVILIASSSGASFTTPLLEQIVRDPNCVRSAALHWIIRSSDHFQWIEETLKRIVRIARAGEMHLRIIVHITRSTEPDSVMPAHDVTSDCPSTKDYLKYDVESLISSHSSAGMSAAKEEILPFSPSVVRRPAASLTMSYNGRPSVESMIRLPVEAALGETAVVVCGSVSLTAEVRTYVAALSDERAVHKGTGAQGIYLFTETYGW